MRIATDIGGTFTDIVYIDDEGAIHVNKSHTTPPNFEKGVMDVIRKCNIDASAVKDLTHGTTVVINALTERKGAKTGLITTRGFRDILEIGRGNRPDLFNFGFKKPEPFVPRYLRLEVSERMDYLGNETEPLNEDDVRACVEKLKAEGVEAIAVVYLHAYVNPAQITVFRLYLQDILINRQCLLFLSVQKECIGIKTAIILVVRILVGKHLHLSNSGFLVSQLSIEITFRIRQTLTLTL